MSLRQVEKTVLQPGMCFHFQSGVWLEDFGVAISESFVVTEKGGACLLLTDVIRSGARRRERVLGPFAEKNVGFSCFARKFHFQCPLGQTDVRGHPITLPLAASSRARFIEGLYYDWDAVEGGEASI